MTAWLDRLLEYERQGLAEIPGPESNPIILHWLQVEGGGEAWVKDDSTPWCAATMCGVFTETGLGHVIPKSEPLRARQWLTVGTDLGKAPRVGAIAVMPRGKDPKAGHVGLVRYIKDGRVGLLGGNQRKQGKDCVCTVEYPASAFLGFRWPLKEKTPKEMAAESRIAAAAARARLGRCWHLGHLGGGSIPLTPPPAPSEAPPEAIAEPVPEHVKEGVENILDDEIEARCKVEDAKRRAKAASQRTR
jgi:uncharacterized protein (TIGR02594 family)